MEQAHGEAPVGARDGGKLGASAKRIQCDARRLERHADAAALLPDDPAGFLDAAMMEDESRRNGLGTMHLDARAAGADVDHVAADHRLFQSDKYRSGPGGPVRPNAMVPSLLSHCSRSR
jgi:hypothetical protein